jgi:hypothetical protein
MGKYSVAGEPVVSVLRDGLRAAAPENLDRACPSHGRGGGDDHVENRGV